VLAIAAQQLEASGITLPAKDSLKFKAIERRLRVQAEEAKIALSEDDDFMLDFGATTQPENLFQLPFWLSMCR